MTQERQVVIGRLAETDSGIDGYGVGTDSDDFEGSDPIGEEGAYLPHDVGVVRVLLHGLRIPGHVHDDDSGLALRDGADHGGISDSGDVVHQGSARVDGLGRHRRLHRVDRKRHVHLDRQVTDDRPDAAPLFLCGNCIGPWPRRFASDVEKVRPLLDQLDAVAQRSVRLEVAAAVRERIGGDVQDAHHAGPVEDDFSGPMAPNACGFGHRLRERPIPISPYARPTGTLYFGTISGPAMRILFLHVDSLEYEVKEKALKAAPDLPASKRRARVDEALAAFISAEKRDEAKPGGAAKAAAVSIEDVASQVHTKRIVLYPYAHLSSSLAAPGPAQEILGLLEK